MLFLTGACLLTGFLVLITKNLYSQRKVAIFLLELSAVLYLGAPITHVFSFNLYLRDLLTHKDNESRKTPVLLIIADIILLISCIFANYTRISKRVRLPVILFLAIPNITSIVQILVHGIYLTNISIVCMAIVLYVFIAQDSNEEIELAHIREMEILENHKKDLEIKVAERTQELRIGINSGNLVAGVIGKSKFIYDVWGDTVNVDSRMESSGEPMHIHVSENTFLQTKDKVPNKGPYKVEVKGKGQMNEYFL